MTPCRSWPTKVQMTPWIQAKSCNAYPIVVVVVLCKCMRVFVMRYKYTSLNTRQSGNSVNRQKGYIVENIGMRLRLALSGHVSRHDEPAGNLLSWSPGAKWWVGWHQCIAIKSVLYSGVKSFGCNEGQRSLERKLCEWFIFTIINWMTRGKAKQIVAISR